MIYAIGLSLIAWLCVRLDEHSSAAPDSLYYLQIAKGERVPRPFCGRWLMPTLLRDNVRSWQIMVLVWFVVGGAAMYRITGSLIGTALWVWLPSARFNLRHPVLVDLAGIVLPLAAVAWLPRDWILMTILMSLIVGSVREWGVIWYAVMLGSPLPLVGLAGTFVGYMLYGRAVSTTDNAFITNPFRTVTSYRMGHLFNYKLMLMPWGVILPLALISPAMPWHWFALAYLPLIIATDHARIYLYAAPMLILAALQAPIPAMWWGGIVLLHLFNPYRGA